MSQALVAPTAEEGRRSMDILHLIDRLEEIVDRSPRIPGVGRVVLDPQELLDLVDRMRIAVPESVRQAEAFLAEPDRARLGMAPGLRQGRDDSRLREPLGAVGVSGDQAEMRERTGLLLREAEEQARSIRQGADQYSMEVLTRLQDQLVGLLNQVHRGIETLERDGVRTPSP